MTRAFLSRRDFLKLLGASALSALISCTGLDESLRVLPTPTSTWSPTNTPPLVPSVTPTATTSSTPTTTPLPTLVPAQLAREIESRIPATQIPVIEYHYPGFSAAGVSQPMDVFIAQLDFLYENGYRSLTDVELLAFLRGEAVFPAKTVGFRIDQGSAHFDAFEQMIALFQERGFPVMVYVNTGENFTQAQWDRLAEWTHQGVISLGSHSVTHPDFRKISWDEAYAEALNSRLMIEYEMAKRGLDYRVISFAFPFDSVPENVEFVRQAGYAFCFGGNLFGSKNNSVRPGQFLLPSLYTYVTNSMLQSVALNPYNSPRSYILVSGYPFDELMRWNTTPITQAAIEQALGRPYPEIFFGKLMPLPISPSQERSLVRPRGIVLHTDGQAGNEFNSWRSEKTFHGLLQNNTDVTLAVGLDGISQFLRMFEGFVVPSRGAEGYSDFLSIEMSGRDYNSVL
ncbi:MAG: polysaccharide deacetylase family protein, partial [Anaerolineales bacterium]|nr:polysaccharide deacetylase family protein [Anaerolineales bacterium]